MNDPAQTHDDDPTKRAHFVEIRRGTLVRHPDGWVATVQGASNHGRSVIISLIVGRGNERVCTTPEHWTLYDQPDERGTPLLKERVG